MAEIVFARMMRAKGSKIIFCSPLSLSKPYKYYRTLVLGPKDRTEAQSQSVTEYIREWAMLVLSRQKEESIMIGDDVEITIVDVRGDKVRLGINAPRSISVHRKEIYLAIQKEKDAEEHPAPTPGNS